MEYQRNGRYFAQIAGSLEKIAAEEFRELGAGNVQTTYRGLSFTAGSTVLYRILYQSRLAMRILAPLISFKCHSEKYLYKTAMDIAWMDIFPPEKSFAINSNVSGSGIKNSLYAGQVLKDAICDVFRDRYKRRPDYNQKRADVRFSLHIRNNWANISLDISGDSLHKRGYRQKAGAAPLQETLAAAMVRLSLWNGEETFCDPFCGSGTILCEALMQYCRIPAGYLRQNWGVFYLPDFDITTWNEVQHQAKTEIRDLPPGLLAGSDVSEYAVKIAKMNCSSFPQGKNIKIEKTDFRRIESLPNMVIVTNPPYGKRLAAGSAEKLMTELGDFLKNKCQGSRAYILAGSKDIAHHLHLRTKMNKLLKNGDIESRLLRVDLY